jgi:hypothetical protein
MNIWWKKSRKFAVADGVIADSCGQELQAFTQAWDPSEHEALCEYTDHMSMKPVLDEQLPKWNEGPVRKKGMEVDWISNQHGNIFTL